LSHDPCPHFGLDPGFLGEADARWPSGAEERVSGLVLGWSYVIAEGSGIRERRPHAAGAATPR
jgi:hypothetical protein